jgi:hypothetical protein
MQSVPPFEPYRQAQAAPNQRQAPRNPQLDAEDQLTPGQIERAQERDRPGAAAPSAKTAAPKQPAEPARVVACGGAFAKDSDHSKLVAAFKPENVDFTDVDAGDGRKLKASVVFPKDPKHRLEVWWKDEAARSGTYLVVIGGQSTWTAPKGVRLGLQLPALEKLNGKPFTIKGFDKDGIAAATDWQNGAFEQLPGNCAVRIFFRPDPKASASARNAVSSDKEFASSDAVVRAVKPAISEILIGY